MLKNFLKILVCWVFSVSTFALVCPDKTNAPKCPTSGSTLLDETYPTQAFVISNAPQSDSLNSQKVTSNYITAIAKSYNFDDMPQIIVPLSTDEDYKKLIDQLKINLETQKIEAKKIQKVLDQVTHVQARSYTWQQDYFESFVDLKTGAPVLRDFQSYTDQRHVTRDVTEKLSAAGEQCSIAKGESFPSKHSKRGSPHTPGNSFGSGEMGGNVEGAPGGFCLTGDNQSLDLSKTYCGKKENTIQLNTSWLMVGHVDEIFKILPSHFSDGRPNECQFSLMAASPKKALDLMGASSNKSKSFFEINGRLNNDERNEAIISRTNNSDDRGGPGNKIICAMVEKAMKDGKVVNPFNSNSPDPRSKNVYLRVLFNLAYAGVTRVANSNETAFNCAEYLEHISTDVLNEYLLKEEELVKLNLTIQKSIDNDKKKIKENILSRLPQCAKYYDEVDAPDLFYGSDVITDEKGNTSLPSAIPFGGSVNSFFPNPTNSVLMNRSLLLPESGSPVFDNYVISELNKRKIETVGIDSWDYAHVGQGNIHCSSHSIPYCKP